MRPMVNHDQFLSNKYIETNVSIVAQVKVELGVAKRHKLKIEVITERQKNILDIWKGCCLQESIYLISIFFHTELQILGTKQDF